MTIRHLITNSSGLGNWTPASDSGEELHQLYRERGITPGNYGGVAQRPDTARSDFNARRHWSRRVADLPLAYEPGTVLHYSIGFDVMALVIERVTGIPYDAFLQNGSGRRCKWTPLDFRSDRGTPRGSRPTTTRPNAA